jgi:hypothetical protein
VSKATTVNHGFKVRSGQQEFELGVDLHRICGLLARRQYGKTTIASRVALKKMMRKPGHTVIFGSVKVDLGREIVRKESEALHKAIALLAKVNEGKSLIDLTDERGKSVAKVSADDFAEIYEAQRLEFRLWHDRTVYSRTKVVALTPAAVGETGDLILDEVGRVKNFREVWEAVKPIIASNPEFRCILTTTPPPDDTHYSFELLAPPLHTEFKPNPKGNWYRSDLGVTILRIDAWDAMADGVPLYDDDTGKAITPEESRKAESDKDAWDRNYGVKFVVGGTAACGLVQLDTAMRRGIGKCACLLIEDEADMAIALAFLREHLTDKPVGIGFDIATTEGGQSNPSSLTILEQHGVEYVGRLTCVWKTREPSIARDRVIRLVRAVNARPSGGRARKICLDASNEVYFATDLRDELRADVPGELVKGGEKAPTNKDEAQNMKAYLGNLLVGALDDNHLTLPPERYIKEDFRLVKREKGSFATEVTPDGKHGDTFDSHKLALWALVGQGGGFSMEII